jgi:hypothetical protein
MVTYYVGSFGCYRIDRVVKFRVANRQAYNVKVALNCPCGAIHAVENPQWRPLREGEEVDVVVHEAD